MMKHLAACAALSLLGLAVSAHASPVSDPGPLSYTLSGTEDSPGGTISGTLTYDPVTGVVSGGTITAYSYVAAGAATFTFASDSAGTAYFDGPASFPFSDGFTLALDGGSVCSDDVSCAASSGTQSYVFTMMGVRPFIAFDAVTSATLAPAVSATPEPSSLVLLGTGVMAAAGAMRRRLLRV